MKERRIREIGILSGWLRERSADPSGRAVLRTSRAKPELPADLRKLYGMIKYWFFRLLGHGLAILPAVLETLAVLPYGETNGLLDRLKLSGSAAVIIAVLVLCLLRNVIRERVKAPAPWAIACGSFLVIAATEVIADKLFYISLAWALGSLAAILPYRLAERQARLMRGGA